MTRPDGTIINARDNEGHDTDWTDVAELSYDSAAMRQARRQSRNSSSSVVFAWRMREATSRSGPRWTRSRMPR